MTVYYATPYTILNRGAVGLVPQRRPFVALLVSALAGAAAFMVTGFVIGSLAR